VTAPDATTLPVPPAAQAIIGALAVEHAREVLDRPVVLTPALQYHRHALRVVADQLAQAIGADQDHRPPPCAGGGVMVHEEAVDGSGVATCTACRRWRTVTHVDGPWWAIEEHPSRHHAACVPAGRIHCVCPLQDNEEPF
jgi:hypothetical protein